MQILECSFFQIIFFVMPCLILFKPFLVPSFNLLHSSEGYFRMLMLFLTPANAGE